MSGAMCPGCGFNPCRETGRYCGEHDKTTAQILISPWNPMTDPVDLKHLGKLCEESGELNSAAARCLIQGIDECEPITGKPNREWLEDEIADVMAGANLCIKRFDLDYGRIEKRQQAKMEGLLKWHSMAGSEPEEEVNNPDECRHCQRHFAECTCPAGNSL